MRHHGCSGWYEWSYPTTRVLRKDSAIGELCRVVVNIEPLILRTPARWHLGLYPHGWTLVLLASAVRLKLARLRSRANIEWLAADWAVRLPNQQRGLSTVSTGVWLGANAVIPLLVDEPRGLQN